MDAEKLKELQIEPGYRRRSSGSLWAIFVLVAVLTVAALYFAWPRAEDARRLVLSGDGKASTHNPGNSAVAAASFSAPTSSRRAAARTNGVVLTVSGYIVNRERIELSPRFLGIVKWIGVKKGDAVTNGQVVALLDDAEQRARLHESEGRLANARTGVAKAELDYERVSKLSRDNVESKQAQDDARLRLDGARASLKEADGQHELANTYLDWTVIRSPINGVVLEKLVDPNELVVPQSFGGARGPSTALIAVADPKDLQVEIDLNEADLSKVHVHQQCRVSPEAYLDRGYEGYVAEIAPEANRQKGTLQVKVQIRNPDHYLTPELSAKVDFLK